MSKIEMKFNKSSFKQVEPTTVSLYVELDDVDLSERTRFLKLAIKALVDQLA